MEPPRPFDEGMPIGRSRRLRTRCTICGQRVVAPIHLEESADAPGPQQSWSLCAACNEAVAGQLAHSPTGGALRLRIAVGIVAAERGTGSLPQAYDKDRFSDRQLDRLLIAVFWAVFLVHALAFIAVTIAISRPH